MAAGNWDPPSMRGLFSDVMPPDSAVELAAIMSEVRPAAFRAMAHALAECDLTAALSEIATPTLLVAGDHDERSPLPVAERVHAALPDAQLRVLPGLGHECYLEDPALFATVLRDFLQGDRLA
jgi:pimeloyl-ACP methyl ester carboxylesterase